MKLNETITQLRREHWSYLLALGAVLLLAVSFMTNLFTELYDTIALGSSTEKAITEIQSHTVNKPQAAAINTKPSNLTLFGTPPSLETTVSSGKYTLLGVKVSTDNPSLAMAIIQSQNNDSDVYHVGDKLPGGGTVISIQQDGVIVQSNGLREKLTLSWDDDDSDNNVAAPPSAGSEGVMPAFPQSNIDDAIQAINNDINRENNQNIPPNEMINRNMPSKRNER